jgi:hypothetical protein
MKRSPLATAALVTGIVFLLVGIAGFIPGITTNYDEMTFAGHESEAELLGIFQISILHNIVHLAFGVAGIAAARAARASQSSYSFLMYGGLIYFALFVYGLFSHGETGANFVPLNEADNVLHLALSVGMIGVAVALRDRRETSSPGSPISR